MNLHCSLAELPERVDLPFERTAYETLTRLWSAHDMPYDWNPNRLLFRNYDGLIRLKRLSQFLQLTFPAPGTAEPVTLLWGRGDDHDLVHEFARAPTIFRTDPCTLKHLNALRASVPFATAPAPGFNDYIYDLPEQVNLNGKPFARRRTYLRSLERSYNSVAFVDLDLSNHSIATQINRINDDWLQRRGPSTTTLDEQRALNRCLSGAGTNPSTRAAGLILDGTLAGFAIYDIFGVFAAAHFVKSLHQSNVVAATWHALFRSAQSAGAKTLNGGYDGGLTGLRSAKRGLIPHHYTESVLVVLS